MIVPQSGNSPTTTMAAALRELETLLRKREIRCCEKVLQQFPSISDDEESLLELLYTEFVIRNESNAETESELVREFQSRFPKLHCELDQLFRVGKVLSPLFGSTPVSDTHGSIPLGQRSSRVPASAPIKLGDYEIVDVLGYGGMGVVYKAIQVSLDRVVAIKSVDVVRDEDKRTRDQLTREAELASQLQHPNIVQIYEVGIQEEIPYFSMEYVDGGTLADAIGHHPLPFATAAKLLATVARAVGFAHEKKILHRDLKPSNVLLAPSDRPESIAIRIHGFEDEATPQGGRSHKEVKLSRFEPKVADFGLAIGLDESIGESRAIGTPSYMAPEQIDSRFGEVGVRSDVYSLGALLYHCLSGRPPFQAPTLKETLEQVRNDEPQPLSTVIRRIPNDLEIICSKCLKKDPITRYASAIDLADDLQRFLTDNPIQAKAPSPIEVATKWSKRHPSAAALIFGCLLAACIATILWRSAAGRAIVETQARLRTERVLYGNQISLASIELQSHDLVRCRQILTECDPRFRDWEWKYLNAAASEAIWESPPAEMFPNSTAISADGRLVVGSYGKWRKDLPQSIDVWDVDTNRKLWSFEGHPPSDVGCVRFHPDGTKLLSAAIVSTKQLFGGVLEWDLANGKLHRKIAEVNSKAAVYSPDGKRIVIGTTRGEVQILDSETGSVLKSYSMLSGTVQSIAFGPQDRFVTVSQDGMVCLWSLRDGLLDKMNDMGDPRQVVWLNNNDRVWVQAFSGLIQDFEIKQDKFHLKDEHQGRIYSYIAVSPDSMMYAKAGFGKGVELRLIHNDQLIRELHGNRGNVRAMSISANAERIVTAGADGVLRVWDLRQSPTPRAKTISGGGAVEDFVCHPKKREFALAICKTDSRSLAFTGDPRLEIRDADSMELLRSVKCHRDWLTRVAYSPSGDRIATGSLDHTICVWDSQTLQLLYELKEHQQPISSLAFVDEATLVSMDRSGLVLTWRTKDTDQKSIQLNKQSSEINPIGRLIPANNGLGQFLAVLPGPESTVQLWSLDRKQILQEWMLPFEVSRIAYSKESRLLALAGERGKCLVYDMHHVESQRKLNPTTISIAGVSRVSSLTFSPNGLRLCSAGEDETVRLFDPQLGTELLNFSNPGIFSCVQFTSDGETLVRFTSRVYETWSTRNRSANIDDSWAIQLANLAFANGNRDALRFYIQKTIQSGIEVEKGRELLLRSELLGSSTSREDADAAYQDLLVHHPNTSSGYVLLYLLMNGRTQEAQSVLRQREMAPAINDPIFVNSMAWYAALMNADRESLEFWGERLRAFHQERKQSYSANTLSLLEYRLGNYDASIKLAEESLKMDRILAAPLDWLIQLTSLLAKAQKLDPLQDKKELDNLKKRAQTTLNALSDWSKARGSRLDAGLDDKEGRFRICRVEVPIVVAELRKQITRTRAFSKMPWIIVDQVMLPENLTPNP